jgi:hypothetical protein
MAPYSEQSFELHPGDFVALFSDGVTEAQDENENEYGEERLADFLRPIRHEPAETLVDKVFHEIERFAGSAPQYDYITLYIIKRNARKPIRNEISATSLIISNHEKTDLLLYRRHLERDCCSCNALGLRPDF